ncbi:CopD family protein [Paenibacillus sp. PL2-23]|uniref:copper resistance D family protein n=1 Tax=Paenibacillus sp. PL2-23 TaxID=2100729 RepID=UPI0030F617F2
MMIRARTKRTIGAAAALLGIGALFLYAGIAGAAGPDIIYVAHDHASTGAGQEALKDNLRSVLLAAVKIVYYFAMLLAAGAMLLQGRIPAGDSGSGQRELLRKWEGPILKTLLVAVLLYVFIHSNHMVSEISGGGEEWLRLFVETRAGQGWLALLVLAVAGFGVIRLNERVRLVWASLLLAAESFGGHVAAVDYASLAIVFDFVHLACAAVWASGVMLLLLFWRADRKEAGRFAEQFAGVAWLTIAILTLSGVLMTWLLLPTPLYLLHTVWGRLLLVKTGLVLLVAAAGYALRLRAKRRELPKGRLLKLDGLLMAAIISAAGILTSISPMPDGKPFNQHRMGEELHYTLRVSPNAPGPNELSLTLWLPEKLGEPQSVSLEIVSADRPEEAPIHVPLAVVQPEKDFEFPGYLSYFFGAENLWFKKTGEWTARLAVTQSDGTTLVREITFSN